MTDATWVGVDAMAWPVQVRADIRHLPFRDESADFLHCAHTIEHIPLEDVSGTLAEFRRVLRKTGVLFISGPDSDRARDAGSRYWTEVSEWGGATAGWNHQWDCTISRLRDALKEAGFVPTWAHKVPDTWPGNVHQWPVDFEVRFLCRRSDCPWPTYFPPGFPALLT